MTTPALTTPPVADSDDFFAEVLANPEARAAFEDAQARSNLVDALVKLRRALGLTQTEVARRMGVKQPMVSGFENEGSDPRLSTIQRYARAVEATSVFKLTLPAHCDWVPRSDRYSEGAESHQVHVKDSKPSALAVDWARMARASHRDFAPAA